MEIFDLIVIGGGPGGYLCAERAAEKKLSVALFEEKSLGGTCLNEGCIPTKALLNSAKLYRHAKDSGVFGVGAADVTYDHEKAVARKDAVVKSLVSGVAATMRRHKVRVINARAKAAGRSDGAFKVEAQGETFLAKRLCIASGSETAVPPIPGLKEALKCGRVLTNREILDLKGLPASLTVIGGGVIGLEMAYYFSSVGVDVTVLELLDKIAGGTDTDVSNALLAECAGRGMAFHLSSRVLEVTEDAVIFENKDGRQETRSALVLLSAGRRAKTEGLGLETLGIEQARGAIITDKHLCTNAAGVYAVGDCNGRLMLAHTAYREAEVAVNHMLGIKDEMRYEHIPAVIYTDPEAAGVGETKQSAQEKGFDVREITVPMQYAGRYAAETEKGSGFCKLVLETRTKRLLGLHLLGPYASEMILAAELMLDTRLPYERLQRLVFPHPTVGEVIRETLFKI
ncbi:MAG: dihydrolipoyl dehydrogenase [Oscillospiraceae bacterium]|jgi:dihydrolipoamide dehydrogenase|nr:dihydrolipoyl dehydrogenase [Oscillospiraceae bacterium]